MARMTRVSPPELARELPGPQASSRTTRAPRRSSCSAVQPPNAPAPTTTTRWLAISALTIAPLADSYPLQYPRPEPTAAAEDVPCAACPKERMPPCPRCGAERPAEPGPCPECGAVSPDSPTV